CGVTTGMIVAPTATDNCAGTITGTTSDPLTYSAQGNYSITWTYDDGNGNTANQTQNVIVQDATLPVADVTNLPDVTASCAVTLGMITAPTATDNCAGTITGTTSDPLTYSVQGNYTITWTYDDGNGNSSTQTQNVNVISSPIETVTFSDAEYTFDGNLHALQVENLPTGTQVTYAITPAAVTLNGAINAGNYTVIATVSPSASTPNCPSIVLTAKLDIKKAPQQITFDALPVKNLGTNNNFNLEATASSGLPVSYSFTYTSALPAANVTTSGLVTMYRAGQLVITAHQDGNDNYLAAENISQILTINNNSIAVSQITIGNTTYENPPKQINYLMECGESDLNLSVLNETNATINPSPNFIIASPKPGIYTQNIIIISEDGATTDNYTIVVEKPFNFFDIVKQKFNNVLLVNNNPQTNGGYEFIAYEWFKNGESIGTGQYYSAGNNISDALDPSAIYKVKLTTKDGKILQTCSTQIELQNSLQAKLYPNPTEAGKIITVDADFPANELEKMQINLYSVSGKLVKTIQSSTSKTEIKLPETADGNMYIVVIETPNIKKSLKVIVK
ncbi:MAG TPA: T9SS type A sorting domain-containing protein, partial [Flavobacterium sp.]|nr:T9SS type A sorting domain-containing protein [Flavobacterium sp.]